MAPRPTWPPKSPPGGMYDFMNYQPPVAKPKVAGTAGTTSPTSTPILSQAGGSFFSGSSPTSPPKYAVGLPKKPIAPSGIYITPQGVPKDVAATQGVTGIPGIGEILKGFPVLAEAQTRVTAAQEANQPSPLEGLLAQLLAYQPPSPAAVEAISVPELPRTDISGLYSQFSPSINSAYDQLMNQLTGARSQQNQSFGDLVNRVTQSYAPARQDVQQGTGQASGEVQRLANQFGLGSTTTGEMGQRWAETAGRLENLAGQNQAAQLGSLDTLRNARDSMYNTFLASAQGGRVGGLASLADAIATGQSNIDVGRSNAQTQLAQAALSGQLDLAKLARSQGDDEFQRKMQIANLMLDMQKLQDAKDAATAKDKLTAAEAGLPSISEEQTFLNPGFTATINQLPENQRQLAQELWASNLGDPDKVISELYGQMRTNDLPQAVQRLNAGFQNVFPNLNLPGFSGVDLQGQPTTDPLKDISRMPVSSDEDLQALIALFQQISPTWGGTTRRITSTTKTPSSYSLEDLTNLLGLNG